MDWKHPQATKLTQKLSTLITWIYKLNAWHWNIYSKTKKILPHLACNILVRKSNYKPILGCVILVLVLNGKAKTSIVVSLALTTPFELNLKALEILLILHNFYEALQSYSYLNVRKWPETWTRGMPRRMLHSKWSGIKYSKAKYRNRHLSYSFFEICNRSFDQYLLSVEIKENECYLDIVTKTEGGIYDVTGITSHTAILRATYRTARLNSHNWKYKRQE